MKAIAYYASLPINDPESLQDIELPAPVAGIPMPIPSEPFVVRSGIGGKLGVAAAGMGVIGAILAVVYGVGDK